MKHKVDPVKVLEAALNIIAVERIDCLHCAVVGLPVVACNNLIPHRLLLQPGCVIIHCNDGCIDLFGVPVEKACEVVGKSDV